MDPIADQVTAALQGVLRLEREAFSQFHDEEHHEHHRENGALEKWYDSLVHESRCRRRKLLNRLFATDATPDPDPGAPQASTGDELEGLIRTLDLLTALRKAYRNLFQAAGNAGDAKAAKVGGKGMASVEHAIAKAGALIDKERKMGRGEWLGTVAQ